MSSPGHSGGGSVRYHRGVISLWPFLAVTLPIVLTPGASTAVVLRNSLQGGTRAGMQTAVGANTGSICFGLLCAFGMAIALERWPVVWLVLRTIGCVYLAWLGVQSLRRAMFPPPPAVVAYAPVSSSAHRNFRDGFVTNVSNPALATFYFILLPQFIPRGTSVARGALLLTLVHVSIAFSYHAAWATAGGTLAPLLSAGPGRRALDLTAGLALVALAIKLVV
jgi:threonine/homoserine/homoserine lactone efflux protein